MRVPITLLAGVAFMHCANQTPSSAPAPTSKAADKPVVPPVPDGQLGDAVVPQAYRLALTIRPSTETFSGRTEIDVRFKTATQVFYMHGLDLTVSSVEVDVKGRALKASYEQVHPTGVARIDVEEAVPAGDATLRFVYTAPFNRKLQGIYRVDDDGEAYAFSQFEAISARLAFPSFDEPRFKTRFDIQVTAADDHKVITTTPETSRRTVADNMVERTFATTQPLPTYLLAFAVGPLDIVEWAPIPSTALRKRTIPLRGAAAKGKGERLKYALKDTAELVTTLESYFGVAYPYQKLDLIAAPDYAFGAMENVGAIVYREERLLLDENSPLELRRAYLMTHSHELAHQWFGNLVTPKWWTDIWLNESFASWCGNRGVSTARPKDNYQRVTLNRALRTTRADALASARQIREPVHTSLEIWNAFDAITYRKGGGILAMFEKFLGDETFQAGVRHHMTQFAHSVADAEDFMASLSAGSQRPEIIPAFRSFIEQPGVPHLDVNVSCSADKAQLEVSQRRYAPLGSKIDVDVTWGVPFCFAVFDRAGQREEKCQIVDQAKTVLPLERCPSAVLPNAGGTGYYHFTLNEGGFDKLLARFSKLQPTEQLSTLQSMEAAFRAGRLSVDAFLAGVQRAVRSKAWDVQIAPLEPLALLIELHDGNEALVQKIARLYRPVVQRIGIRARRGEPDAYKLARPDLIRFFALAVADRRTRRALLPIAERELAGKLRQGETAVAKTALAVAVADKGKAFVDRVVAKLVIERDGFARSKLVAALAHAPAAERSRVFGLVVDTRLRVNESIGLVRSLFSVSKHRRATLDWMDKNYDALAARLPSQFQGRILESTANLCDEASLATVESIGQRAAHRQGTVRTVAQVREAIGLCVALKNAVAGSAATAGR